MSAISADRAMLKTHCFIVFLSIISHGCAVLVEITKIQTSSERSYLTINTTIHSNRTSFDVNITMHRTLWTHDMIMNMKLKLKTPEMSQFEKLYSWRRIDLCKFLLDYDRKLANKLPFTEWVSGTRVLCPIRRGNYCFKNFLMGTPPVSVIPSGRYRFFAEVAQKGGDIAKLFAIQIHTIYQA